MNTETISAAELEELLAEEIPCMGIRTPRIARTCTQPAALKLHSHVCAHTKAPYKCLACWQILITELATWFARYGSVSCPGCGAVFYSVAEYADYRPF